MMSGIITIAALISFVVVVLWAAWPGNANRFKAAAELPLREDQPDQQRRGKQA